MQKIHEWVVVASGQGFRTMRMAVPGGWLYLNAEWHEDHLVETMQHTMVFVPSNK